VISDDAELIKYPYERSENGGEGRGSGEQAAGHAVVSFSGIISHSKVSLAAAADSASTTYLANRGRTRELHNTQSAASY
jgi:hypothetical protein